MSIAQFRLVFPHFRLSIRNSYTQILFSKDKILGWTLMLISFFDWQAGLAGWLSVVVANLAAYLSGLNRQKITDGLYGFNALLVGLGLGSYYQFNAAFLLVILFAALLSLLVTTLLEGILSKYNLPFLSLPFLITYWMSLLSTRDFGQLELSEHGLYKLNEMFLLGGLPLLDGYEWINNLSLPEIVKIYFRSLGAIYFQYHLFAGLLVAIALFRWSRQALLFSVVGFAAAWLLYKLLGINIQSVSYSYIGFNYILTSIAIGGFFLVPSAGSLIWLLLAVPLTAFVMASGNAVFGDWQVGIYSLPFNVVVLLVLYLLRLRERFTENPPLVFYQQYSAEQNQYNYLVNRKRLAHLYSFPVKLPFWGIWKVTQAFDGEFTHKDAWRHAWDFEMTDQEGKTYRGQGLQREDYYCFDKPVVSPADGVVQEVTDGIADNPIGDMNLSKNWGNTVLIYHATGLYSQLSHLKKGSIMVKPGQTLRKGEQVACCGNSGRSPYPHLHVQFQSVPEIGATTLDFPFSGYLTHDDSRRFYASGQPKKDELVSNLHPEELLHKALHFIPGQELRFEVLLNGQPQADEVWFVETDMYNNTYLQCKVNGARAWLVRQPDVLFFTHYDGPANSTLRDFFLGAYQLTTGFEPGLKVDESISLHYFPHTMLRLIQDVVAPFYRFLSIHYQLEHYARGGDLLEEALTFRSTISFCAFGKTLAQKSCELLFRDEQLNTFVIREKGTEKILRRV
ncbi:MAG TPA: urea transporter [Bacteroidales bacterium]|nr:urea transporter [Bacteroidales bacterium]